MRWGKGNTLLIVGVAIPFLIIVLYNTPFVQNYTKKLIGEKLIQLALASNPQINTIAYQEVEFSLLTSQLFFQDLAISFHPKKDQNRIDLLAAEKIKLDVNGLWKVYFEKSLDIKRLAIENPKVDLHKNLAHNEKTTLSLQTGDIYNTLSHVLRTLSISTFELTNGHFTIFLHGQDGTSTIIINDLSTWIENFQLDKESENRNDKILFTDNIKVKLRNQSVYLPDSIHAIHFDSLLLSTSDDSFLVHGFRVQSEKEEVAGTNYYDLHVPLLAISNIDFTRAYNDHELQIDKILFLGGDVTIDNKKTTPRDRNPDLLLQLNDVFGKLVIGELKLENTKFSMNAHPIGVPAKFELRDLDLSIFEIDLDHSNTSIDFEHRYFKNLELSLKNHSFEMADNNHKLEVEDLYISTKKLLFTARKIAVEPIVNDSKLSALHVAQIEHFKVEGFDPYQFVNERQLLLKLIQTQKLTIKTTPQNRSRSVGINPIKSMENLFPYIKPYTEKLKIDSLSIQNIDLDIATKNGPFIVKGASLQIDNFDLDSTTHLLPENIFHSKNFIVSIPSATLSIENQQLKIENFYINKELQLLSTKGIQISKKGKIGTFGIAGSVDAVYFNGVKLRQLLYHQKFLFDSLIIKHPILEIEKANPAKAKGKKHSKISNYISEFEIGMISIEDGEINYHEGGLEIASINNLSLSLVKTALSSTHLARNEVLVKYDDFFLSFNNLYYSTPELKHVLRVQSCNFHLLDSTGVIKNISIDPLVDQDSLSLYTLSIPEITFKGINDYRSSFNKKIDISSLRIQRPSIAIQAGTAGSTKSKGFPILKSNMFLFDWDSLGIYDFQIIRGSLAFHKKNERVKVNDFNLTVKNFEVHTGKEMTPERFLFSKEVDVKLSSINYFNATTKDSIAVNKVILNSKTNTLELVGIKLSVHQTNPIVGSIPAIKFSGFSFYEFTQNKNIVIDAVVVSDPILDLTIPKSSGTNKVENFAQLNTYPFDTAHIASIDVKSSLVTNAKVLGFQDSVLSVGKIRFGLTNFVLHPDTIAKHNLPFHSEKFEITLTDLSYKINPLNKIQIGMLDYSSNPSTVTIQSLSLVPLYDKVAYGEKVGKQVGRISLTNSQTKINNLNFKALIGKKSIEAKTIVLDDLTLDIYKDKRLPFPANQVKELPQRLLRELPIGIHIDSLALKSGRIEYVEQSAKVNATGSIFFDNMHASITNITNDSLRIAINPIMQVKAETNMYGTGLIVARFDFDLADPDFGYQYSTSIGTFDLVQLNTILEPALLAKIKQGELNSLQQVVSANDNYAQGEMIFRYDNLKVGLINGLNEESPGLGKALASFFANTFIVRKRNPAPFVRKSDVFFERNHAKSIFDFLVKSTLSGVVESIGARSNRRKIRKHKKEAKELAKKKKRALPSDSE